jgi:hypothetical protein
VILFLNVTPNFLKMEKQQYSQKLKERVEKITDIDALQSFLDAMNNLKDNSYENYKKPTFKQLISYFKEYFDEDIGGSALHRLLNQKPKSDSNSKISRLLYCFVIEHNLIIDINDQNFLESINDSTGKKIFSRSKNEKTETEKYLAYYWKANNKIGLGTLIIKKTGNGDFCDGDCGTYTVYYSEGDRKLLCTQIYKTERHMYIRLENEITPILPQRILSQISIVLPEPDRTVGHYLIGSYTTVHRGVDEAVAGLIVLDKFEGDANKELIEEIKGGNIENIKPEIFYYLYSQRLSARKADRKEFLPFQNELKILEDFVGTYQGYYVNYLTERVSLYKCKISKNGEVINEYPPLNSNPIIGYVKFINKHVLMIWFNFKEEQYNRFNYIISLPSINNEDKKNKNIILKGIAAGIDKSIENPFSGKFYLKSQNEDSIKIRTMSNEESTIFFQESEKKKIAQFLISEDGDEIKYDDSFVRKIYNKNSVKNTFANLAYEFKGEYEIFVSGRVKLDNSLIISRVDRLSDSGIIRYRLIIGEDGKVTLKGENDIINCIGIATILENRKYLQVTLSDATKVSIPDKITGNGFEGIIIFSLKSTTAFIPTELKHLFGIMIKMDDTRMQGLACMLTQVHNDIPSISKFQRGMDSISHEDKDWGFDEFDQVFGKGLLSFMEGTSYRVQRLPQTANRPLRPRKKEYRRLYFYSACHLALRMNNNEKNNIPNSETISEIELCITEAFKHGFGANYFAGYKINKELLKQSNKVFFEKFGAKEEYLAELKADFESLIDDRRMLQDELKNVDTFGQPQIYEMVKRLWSDIEI